MASGMPWVKLYTEFLDDPKVGFLDELAQLLLVKLFLLAGECDAEGYLANGEELLTKEHVAWRLRIPGQEFCQRWAALEDKGFVAEEDDGALLIVKFQDRQGRSQSEKREQWRNRKRKQRETVDGQPQESDECHAGITGDTNENHAPRVEKSREEKSREEKIPSGADAPSTTFIFPEWQEKIRQSSNRQAVVREMIEILYPGLDPPNHGYIVRVAKKVGGWGRLADLLWQHSTRPPTGDLLAYIQGVAKHNGRPNAHQNPHGTTEPVELATGFVEDAELPSGPDPPGVG